MGAKFSAAVTPQALAANTTKTMLWVLGSANVNAALCELGISFNGTVSVDAPIRVELMRITAGGTAAATPTRYSWSRNAGTAQCTVGASNSVEPTGSEIIGSWFVHPQGGNLLVQWPLGREPIICDGSASQGLAIRYTSPGTLSTTSYTGYIVWEE